jgi:uncharacterized protein
MELKTYFFDTYAFIEIIKGNPNYDPYKKNIAVITNKFNLLELHYALIKDLGEKDADAFYDRLERFAVDMDGDTIKQASKFRSRNKKKKLSYVDCVGYIFSKRKGIPFLTGDKEFENLDSVEFVK